jgi:diguanylate cyclase (GGDEF)-like protein/PAS domain S-box-containing protein
MPVPWDLPAFYRRVDQRFSGFAEKRLSVASSGGSDPLCAAEDSAAVAGGPGTDITAQWLQALAAVGNSTGEPGWARQLIDGLTAMITGMAARPDDARQVGANVGRELVTAHFTHTETIAVTIETMQRLLPERFDPGTRVALFAGLAEGYAHALRERVYTEQERIQQALQDAHRADTMRLQAALHNTAVGIVIADDDGWISEANSAIGRILGLGLERLRTSNIRNLSGLCGRPDLREAFEDLLAGRRTHHQTENSFTAPDGRTVHTRIRTTVLPGADGRRTLVTAVEDISELRALHQQLLQQAACDPLTRLPNRDRLVQELATADRTAGSGHRIGVCFLDLDDFTSINDTLGHQTGNRLLTTLADRLRAVTDPSRHLVTRTGADEFAIMVRDCDGPADLTELARNALAAVREPVEIDGRPVHMTASVGLVEPCGGQADPNEVLRAGDAALSWAKSDSQAQWALFEPDRHARQRRRRMLSQQLPSAIDRGELFLEYQPIVDLADGGVRRMEALVRWNHPSRGRLGPDQFVPLAEQSGAIIALGRWVLRHAVADAAGWPSAPDGRRVEVAVNVTVRQLHEPHICDEITALLAEAGLPAALLHVEITESEVLQPEPENPAVQTLRALADLGVGVAIDDFGTGYSSLAYLHRLPAHTLKIDQSFVADLASVDQPDAGIAEAVVAGVIDLAHACKMTVTVEGVQTRAQLLRLRALGAEAAQGFLLGRPVPGSQVPTVLATPIAL